MIGLKLLLKDIYFLVVGANLNQVCEAKKKEDNIHTKYKSDQNYSSKAKRKMHLRYYLDENGKRVYTLKTVNDNNEQTLNAHPARFSPDDPYQKERYECKKRYNLLPTQQPPLSL